MNDQTEDNQSEKPNKESGEKPRTSPKEPPEGSAEDSPENSPENSFDPAANSSKAWPKTKAGTVKWELVFEDPERGLLALVSHSETPTALLERAIFVIKKIYTRKDDPAEIEIFIKDLTALIPEDLPAESLTQVIEVVVTLLRQIKDFRIEKAAEHEEKLAEEKRQEIAAAAQEAAAERRKFASRRQAERRSEKRFAPSRKIKLQTNPVTMIGVATAVIVVVAALSYIISGLDSPPGEEEKRSILMSQLNDAVAAKKSNMHVFGGALRAGTTGGKPSVSITAVPLKHCFKLVWGLRSRGKVFINRSHTRNLKSDKIKRLCDNGGSYSEITFVPKK